MQCIIWNLISDKLHMAMREEGRTEETHLQEEGAACRDVLHLTGVAVDTLHQADTIAVLTVPKKGKGMSELYIG